MAICVGGAHVVIKACPLAILYDILFLEVWWARQFSLTVRQGRYRVGRVSARCTCNIPSWDPIVDPATA